MSYENDDMIENSDRGYEMNLDRVMQDMYQKSKEDKLKNPKHFYIPNVRYIDGTNRMFNCHFGEDGKLSFSINYALFSTNISKDIKTSYIIKAVITDNILKLQTRNSIYQFEILNNIENQVLIDLSKDEIKYIEDNLIIKKEVKKDKDYLKLDSNIPMKTLIQEDIKNSDNDFIISTLNRYQTISDDKYVQKLSLRCTKSHNLNKLFLCQIKEHLYRKRMSKILTIDTQNYLGWVDKFKRYFKDIQDDDIKTLLDTYTKGVLKLKNDFENIDDCLDVTPIEYRNYMKRLNSLSDICHKLHSIYKVYKED
jgi:hypothetical protein